jgi:hypothetical protein
MIEYISTADINSPLSRMAMGELLWIVFYLILIFIVLKKLVNILLKETIGSASSSPSFPSSSPYPLSSQDL